jgi:uncharacterized membrane protein
MLQLREWIELAAQGVEVLAVAIMVSFIIYGTIAIDMTPINLALLGGLVLVRTFLGWAVTVEIEGHWPWQKTKKSHPSAGEEVTLGE